MRKIELVPRLTPDAAQALWYEMEAEMDSAGRAVTVLCDASAVRHLSASALQVLLVARVRAQRAEGDLSIVSPSDEFRAALQAMGAVSTFEEVIG